MLVQHERLPSLDRFLEAYMAGRSGEQPCHITGKLCDYLQKVISSWNALPNLHNPAPCNLTQRHANGLLGPLGLTIL